MLTVMHNNRACHEELIHVQRMANRHNRGVTPGSGPVLTTPTSILQVLSEDLGCIQKAPSPMPKSWSGNPTRALRRRTANCPGGCSYSAAVTRRAPQIKRYAIESSLERLGMERPWTLQPGCSKPTSYRRRIQADHLHGSTIYEHNRTKAFRPKRDCCAIKKLSWLGKLVTDE
jgi:hypothetical protein